MSKLDKGITMLKPSIVSLLLIVSADCAADFSIPGITTQHINPLSSIDSALAQTGLSVNEDDITTDQNTNSLKLSPHQLHEAQVWGLTPDEEKRYIELMANRNSIYYDGLRQTPIDILGINARNALERDHFAELAAEQEAQKVAKNIAWNNAFYKAYNHLFKDVPIVGDFDPAPYAPTHYKPVVLNTGDQLYLFIKPSDAIKTVLMTLSDVVNTTPNARLHVMLLHTDDHGIQQWANVHQIPRQMVTTGQITLNQGEQHFETLTIKKKKTPLLLLARNGASHVVDLGRF